MSGVTLSEGAISVLLNGGKFEDPVLQILGFKKMTTQGTADRYRLLISDGKHTHSFAMLATQLNDLITSGELSSNTVVRVKRHMCNTVNTPAKTESQKAAGSQRILILLELDIVKRGEDVGAKIGNPTLYADSGSTQSTQQTESAAPLITSTKPQPPMSDPLPKPSTSYVDTKPKLPINTFVADNVDNGMSVSKTHPIISLSPYQNNWTIKARVSNKSAIRTYQNQRGEGKLFSFDLLDESGEIRVTAFNDQCDKYYEMIEMNKVYYISKASLKTANKRFTSINNDYEMTLNGESVVQPCCENVADIPTISFNFIPIPKIEEFPKDSVIDVIGVCKKGGDLVSIVTRTTNRELKKLEVTLVDAGNVEVTLTFWGAEAESFQSDGNPVVAIKGARVSDFGGGRSISTTFSSVTQINPDIREAHMLRGWYDNQGHSMESTSISGRTGGSMFNKGGPSEWKTLREIKSETLAFAEKAEYFTCKAGVALYRKKNSLYMACPQTDCNKKVVDMGNGLYRCEKCNQEFPSFKWRLMLQMNLVDCYDNAWVTSFNESAESILEIKADELGQMQQSDPNRFEAFFKSALFKTLTFRLRAKYETFNDETRLKTSVVDVAPMNAKSYARHLLSEIKEMSNSM